MVTLLVLESAGCFHCRLLEPVLDRLREEYRGRLTVVSIDVNDNPDQALVFRLRKTPTLIMYDALQRAVWRHEGFVGRDGIVQVLDQVLVLKEGEGTGAGSQ